MLDLRWTFGVALVALCACEPLVRSDGEENAGTAAPEEDESLWSPSGGDPGMPTDDAAPDSPAEPEPEPDAITGAGFITDPDGGIEASECSLYDQDCGPGEKCNVWANDGGSVWNATRCVPLESELDRAGEPCHSEGPGTGVDTCELGSFCWDIDAEGNGMCTNFCEGTEESPDCSNPDESVAWGKTFCLCLPVCDPLINDCPVGCGCYAADVDRFQCVPDASGEDAGRFGDPCEFTNACDPGLHCTSSQYVECAGASCCTYFCDLTAQDTCPGAHVCTPLYEDGTSPPDNDDVGLCLLP